MACAYSMTDIYNGVLLLYNKVNNITQNKNSDPLFTKQ